MAEIMHFAPRGSGAESTDQVATAPGLGLFPDAYVDTHFAQRRRLPRLFSLVQTTPTRLGLGLDEDTGVVLQGQRFDVVGQGAVTVIDGRPYADDARAGMVVHVLRGGDAFDLAARTPIFSAWRRDYALWSPDDTRGRRVDRSSAWPAPRM
jgi:cyanophycinase